MKNLVAIALCALFMIGAGASFAQNESTPMETVEVSAPAAEQIKGAVPASEVSAIDPAAPVLVKNEEPSTVTDADFFQSIGSAIGGMKGASTIVIIGILLQIAFKFLSTPLSGKTFPQLSGKTKITVVLVLSTLSTLVGLVAQGMDWKAAALSGVGLAAISSLIQQLWTQYVGQKSA